MKKTAVGFSGHIHNVAVQIRFYQILSDDPRNSPRCVKHV